MKPTRFTFTLGIAALLSAAVAFSQHTPGAKFDLTKPLTLKGTVTQIDWANPNVHILMKVPGTPRPTLWAIEVDGAVNLAKNGWTETSLAAGDSVTVQGFVARDGSKQISGNTITTASGKKVYAGTNGTIPP